MSENKPIIKIGYHIDDWGSTRYDEPWVKILDGHVKPGVYVLTPMEEKEEAK